LNDPLSIDIYQCLRLTFFDRFKCISFGGFISFTTIALDTVRILKTTQAAFGIPWHLKDLLCGSDQHRIA